MISFSVSAGILSPETFQSPLAMCSRHYFIWQGWLISTCPLSCSDVIYGLTLHCARVFRLLFFSCWGHSGSLEFELDLTVKEPENLLFFPCVSLKTIGPFVFCLYVFVMLNVIESTPTCLHWLDLIVLHLWVLKEEPEWRQFYCAGLCAIHTCLFLTIDSWCMSGH